ncbi:Cation-independent mannose-6-phosphate receptor [Trichoplax sp. H2]|nr:Cation-independent mannose-6-phosphate receptor [Trichoplax sp. H2]|eukprot:RDD41852.1 Cation-independent mannose-6-phosphate receptor [Trichoplax sp. H2]
MDKKAAFNLLISIVALSSLADAFDQCNIKSLPHQFQVDRLSGLWQAHSEDHSFFINLCGHGMGNTNCPPSSAICRKGTLGKAINIGSYTDQPTVQIANGGYRFGFALVYSSNQKCEMNGNTNMNTSIAFTCGKTLGSPEFIEENNCVYYFNWKTSAACYSLNSPSSTEIPCYIYDDQNQKRDLSLLMKEFGAYAVKSQSQKKLYINVCRNIQATQSSSLQNCGSLSSACVVSKNSQDGSTIVDGIGQPSAKLTFVNQQIKLVYESKQNYSQCSNKAIVTNVSFRCGKSKDNNGPTLIHESQCRYDVEWITELACPMEDLISHSCILKTNNGYFNLLSLRNQSSDYQVTVVTSNALKYTYLINVCGPVKSTNCGYSANGDSSKPTAACQVVAGQHNVTHRLGNFNDMALSYIDDKLSLTYYDGSPCHDGFKRSTVISFICDHSIKIGSPQFVQENHCTYFFRWATKYACKSDSIDLINEDFTSGLFCSLYDNSTNFMYNMIPLRLSNNRYNLTVPQHKFQLNICDQVWGGTCNKSHPNLAHPNPSACDSELIIGQTSGHDTLVYEQNQIRLKYNSVQDNRKTTINFLCDMNFDSNSGKVSYVQETTNHNYIFNFATPLACGPKPISCITSDTKGNYYDLSDLYLSSGNWDAVDGRPDEAHLQYKINMCGPVNIGNLHCPNISHLGGCQVDSKNNRAFSMGVMTSNPEVVNGNLIVRYVNGDICHGRFRRSTRVELICSDTQGSLVFIRETPSCEYIFTWTTPSACPVKKLTGNNCQVEDPLTQASYDLRSLASSEKDYKITMSANNFYSINVCRKLVNQCGTNTAGACLTTGQSSRSLGTFNEQLIFNNGYLQLNYTNGGSCPSHAGIKDSTILKFFCDESINGVGVGPQVIKGKASCVHEFHWNTSIACPIGNLVDCAYVDVDKGKQYDLSSLSKTTGNWVATVVSPMKSNWIFQINVCRSVNNVNGCKKSSGICLTVTAPNKNSTYNLGRNKRGPYVKGGTLYLEYTDGDACPDGTKKRSTLITMVCKKGKFGPPLFVSEENQCNYNFIWIHEAACALSLSVSGNCTAVNPLSGFVFDFNPLYSISSGYNVTDGRDHVYNLNVCGTTSVSSCGNTSGNCQLKKNDQKFHFNGGNANAQLYYEDGAIYLNYTGGDLCHQGRYRRSTIISFVCSSNAGKGHPVYVSETNNCTYYFSWPTQYACEQQVECVAMKPDGSSVDLSPLIKSTDNWEAVTIGGQNGSYYINLCRPLNPISNVRCPPGSGICLKKLGTDPPLSLGRPYQKPTIASDGTVILNYINGSRCPSDSSKRLSAKIVFSCQQGTLGSPVIAELPHNCQYVFHWATSVVCNNIVSNNSTCSVYDPALKFNFTLSHLTLSDNNYVIKSGSNTIELNVCSPVNGQTSSSTSGCANSGVCLHTPSKNISLGLATSRSLTYSNSLLILKYTNGEVCASDNTRHYSSTIFFVCDRNEINSKPVLMKLMDKCSYQFDWNTHFACPILSQNCMIKRNGKIYDVSPLSQITGSWKITDSSFNQYWINLCRPIVNGPPGCSSNAAICKLGSTETQATELAFTSSQKIALSGDSKKLLVSYTGGKSVCPKSSVDVASVVIEFSCGSGIGKPSFLRFDKNKCTFHFTWRSHVACPSTRYQASENNCIISGKNAASPSFNFNVLTKVQQNWNATESRSNGDNYIYFLNVCHNLNPPQNINQCKSGSVCQTKTTGFRRKIGGPNTSQNRKFYVDGDIIEMHLPTNEKCGKDKNKNVATIILFSCAVQNSLGSPKFLYESGDCKYYFEWSTSAVCESVPAPQGGIDGGIVAAIIVSIAVVALFLLFICRRERRRKLKQMVLRVSPDGYNYVPGNDGSSDRLLSRETRRYQRDDDDDLLNI